MEYVFNNLVSKFLVNYKKGSAHITDYFIHYEHTS